MDDASEQTGWRRWLEEQVPRFLLFARQRSQCEADAQDLVQEALVEAARRNGDAAPPSAALVYAIIRCRAIDWARRQERRMRRELEVADAPEPWFDTSVETREQAEIVQSAMSRLPEIYREAITLKIWGGLTFAEIGEVLGIPKNTAASRYRYALQELRALMKGVLS